MNGNCEKFYVAKVVKAPHSKEEKKCSAPANSFCIDQKENTEAFSGSRCLTFKPS